MSREKQKKDGTLSELSSEIFNLIKKLGKQYDQEERDLIKIRFRSHGISGITPQQFFVLRVLWFQDGFSLKYLAMAAHCSRSTMTGIIDTMEKDGLVFRENNPKDGRSKIIRLTEKGKELQHYKPPSNQRKSNYLGDFKTEEVYLLIELLKKLSNSMEK